MWLQREIRLDPRPRGLPIAGGRLALGTWQGIYLCEHRDAGGARRLVATAWGEAGG